MQIVATGEKSDLALVETPLIIVSSLPPVVCFSRSPDESAFWVTVCGHHHIILGFLHRVLTDQIRYPTRLRDLNRVVRCRARAPAGTRQIQLAAAQWPGGAPHSAI